MKNGASAGWTTSTLELTTTQLLERVYESKNSDGGLLDLNNPSALGGDPELIGDAARVLVADGLAYGGETMGSGYSSLAITDPGRTLVRARRERRSNRVQRAIACREALLSWAYDRPGFVAVETFASDVRAHFEGDPFSDEEIRTAALDLKAKGLVKSIDVAEAGPVHIEIATRGKDVVEGFDGSIKKYENPSGRSGDSYTFAGNNISGIVVTGNSNEVSQTNGATPSELAGLIKAVLDAAQGTGVEKPIGKVMAQLELEADEEQPDNEIVGKFLDRGREMVTTVATKATGNLLTHAFDRVVLWFHDHGIAQGFGLG